MKSSTSTSDEEKYLAKWNKFINKNPLDQPKVWQYWRDDIRPKSQFNKKIINRFNKSVKSQQKAKGLIRSGIPDNHRGEVWWACSGGAELMATSQQSYADYLKLALDCSENPAAEAILKDLHRTVITKEVTERKSNDLNERPSTVTVPSIDDAVLPLKNILMAYSMRNPVVGYCQSMNFLCAMLLLYMEEEQAFWVLTSLVERLLLQDYYAPSMIGIRVDQLTFQSCLAWKLPHIYSHLRKMDVILEPILCPWFLCLFVHVLSLDAVQRIWDCFFFEGNVILFRIGLSICKLLENDILQAQDVGSLFILLKKPFEGALTNELIDTLLATSFDKSWLGSIPRAALDHFRKEHIVTLRELDHSKEIFKEPTVFRANSEDDKGGEEKKKSNTVFSGVDRSLASVIQSDSFRGKIDQRLQSSSIVDEHDMHDNKEEDEELYDEEGEEDASKVDISDSDTILVVPTIAFQPPKNRRTSIAMKSLLT